MQIGPSLVSAIWGLYSHRAMRTARDISRWQPSVRSDAWEMRHFCTSAWPCSLVCIDMMEIQCGPQDSETAWGVPSQSASSNQPRTLCKSSSLAWPACLQIVFVDTGSNLVLVRSGRPPCRAAA